MPLLPVIVLVEGAELCPAAAAGEAKAEGTHSVRFSLMALTTCVVSSECALGSAVGRRRLGGSDINTIVLVVATPGCSGWCRPR